MATIAEALILAGEHFGAGRFEEVQEICGQILGLQPEQPDALRLLAFVDFVARRVSSAEDYLRRAAPHEPTDPNVLLSAVDAFVGILQREGWLAEAVNLLCRLLLVDPRHAMGYAKLSELLRMQGQPGEAVAAAQKALALQPDSVAGHFNLAAALRDLGAFQEAEAHWRRVLDIEPQNYETHINLARVLSDQDKYGQAKAMYEQAWQLRRDPVLQYEAAALMPSVYDSTEEIRAVREAFANDVAQLAEQGFRVDPAAGQAVPLFNLAYHGQNDRALLESAGRLFVPSPPLPARAPRAARTDRRPRIGFASCLLKDHTVGHMWRGNIAGLSCERFAVTVFLWGDADDPVTQFLRQRVEHFQRLPPDVASARKILEQAELDVLVYPDVGMALESYNMAGLRLAPVQCASWGHASTTGLPTIDYFLSSELLEPDDAQEHYTERLVRFRTLGLYLERPPQPRSTRSRAAFGLPDDKRLYGCLQRIFKMHPDNDLLWGGILRHDPRGELLLVDEPSPNIEVLRNRWRRTIPDVAGRIRFIPPLPYDDYLRLTTLCDALLDPVPFGGGRTSWEALGLGAPIVTWPGRFLRGRMCAAMYRALGVHDCIAAGVEQFVDTAVRLANDRPFKDDMSRRILEAGQRLFEDRRAVAELAEFFEQVAAG